MADWMDELKSSVENRKASNEQARASQMRKEADDRYIMTTAFNELLNVVEQMIPMLNQKLYGTQTGIPKRLELKYEDNTITGDHFVVVLSNLSFKVKYDQKTLETTANLFEFKSINRRLSPISQANFTLMAKDGKLYLKEESKAITVEQVAQKLLTKIVETAEG